jgi:hypothetical protein
MLHGSTILLEEGSDSSPIFFGSLTWPPGPFFISCLTTGGEAARDLHQADAGGPKEAVRAARAIQLTPGMSATVFDVWAYVAGKMHRIDLVEEPDRLDQPAASAM